ncbi:MAG: hypothetical protein L0214_12555, partial [candidate division NC10 bacterium]|nr:hypothetical protein [candidate division NC10 bacterium]
VPIADYGAFRERLARQLMEFRDSTGEPVVGRVWTREEAFSGPFMHLAPDLTLELRDGGLVSILPAPQVLRRRPEVAGAHRPLGVFLARGPGIRKGERLAEISILDVAPILLYSLGLAVPGDLPGRVQEEIFEPATLDRRPVQFSSPAPPVTARSGGEVTGPVLGQEEEAVLTERLRELGYIE